MPVVAVIQDAPVAFDRVATLDRVRHLVADAAGRGAELVVLPEAFVSGYPKGLDFGARVGSRSEEGRDMFQRYHESAVEVPGPDTEVLGESARACGVHLVIGVIERASGTLYCTALFFGPDGELLGKHRKLVPTAVERIVWGSGDGSTLTVVDTPLGKIGAVICWENYMPLLRTAMYAKGVQLYCAPTVDDRDSWLPSMRHIAVEGRCFVLSCCQFARRRDFPADYPSPYGEDPDAVLIRGGSCIVSPFGEVLAGPAYGEACILVSDVDLGQIVRGKYDLDVVGHYARPDVFQLSVDERSRPAVERRRVDPDS
jgi:nitrilase